MVLLRHIQQNSYLVDGGFGPSEICSDGHCHQNLVTIGDFSRTGLASYSVKLQPA